MFFEDLKNLNFLLFENELIQIFFTSHFFEAKCSDITVGHYGKCIFSFNSCHSYTVVYRFHLFSSILFCFVFGQVSFHLPPQCPKFLVLSRFLLDMIFVRLVSFLLAKQLSLKITQSFPSEYWDSFHFISWYKK